MKRLPRLSSNPAVKGGKPFAAVWVIPLQRGLGAPIAQATTSACEHQSHKSDSVAMNVQPWMEKSAGKQNPFSCPIQSSKEHHLDRSHLCLLFYTRLVRVNEGRQAII